jgi:DNA-binding transcriptional LysR family regulator
MDDLHLLRVFREVALRGSFSAAAQALSYTQPAVSQQVARLERGLDTRLIDREPKGLRLTPAGDVVLRHTERLLAQIADANAELADLEKGTRGHVRIGSMATASGTFVSQAIANFRRERQGIELDLRLVFPPEAVGLVRQGELEIAISQESGFGPDPDTRGLHVEHLLDDPLYAVLPTDHPLATRRTVAIADLARDPLVLLSLPGSETGDNVVMRAYREAGVEPDVAHVLHDHFAIEGFVAAGMGVALLPLLALAATRGDVVTRPLGGTPPRRRILAVTADPPAPATQAMVDALRDAAGSTLAAQPG